MRAHPVISRSQLARKVNVSRATVSGIIAELQQAGVVEEVGLGASTGGRPPVHLRYRPDSRLVVGVTALDDKVHAALTDMEGHPLEHFEVPLAGNRPDDMLEAIREAIHTLLCRTERARVLGVGIGTPGLVDIETGIIEGSVGKGWLNGPVLVKAPLERDLGLPVYVANRSRVAALGEHSVGVGQDVSNLIYVFLGQGIAAGIVIDGQLYAGPNFSAGEVGHITIVPDGLLCQCGNRGCLETYAAEGAIVARARAAARENPDGLLRQVVGGDLQQLAIEHVIRAAEQGDNSALGIFAETGTYVGIAISTLIQLFNPEMVVVGGPVGCSAGPILLSPIIKEAQRRTLPRPYLTTQIVSGTLGTEAAAIGAAVLALDYIPIDALFSTSERPTITLSVDTAESAADGPTACPS